MASAATAALGSLSEIDVDGFVFPPTVKPSGSVNTLFLAGAGLRGLDMQGEFVKFSSIGVYLEESAVELLAKKWKGKTAEELFQSLEFFRDIITGPFEKFTRVSLIRLLTGVQYSNKVAENCVAIMKSAAVYTENEEQVIRDFKDIFKNHSFPPSSSVLFTQSVDGNFTIGFSSKSDEEPDNGVTVMKNATLGEAVLESIIGEHGVSPAARKSMAERLAALFSMAEGGIQVQGVVDEESSSV